MKFQPGCAHSQVLGKRLIAYFEWEPRPLEKGQRIPTKVVTLLGESGSVTIQGAGAIEEVESFLRMILDAKMTRTKVSPKEDGQKRTPGGTPSGKGLGVDSDF